MYRQEMTQLQKIIENEGYAKLCKEFLKDDSVDKYNQFIIGHSKEELNIVTMFLDLLSIFFLVVNPNDTLRRQCLIEYNKLVDANG